jgi:hypothetical protein
MHTEQKEWAELQCFNDGVILKIFRTAPSSGKVMPILFFDWKGIILRHWLLQKAAGNGIYYANTLKTHLRNAIWKNQTRILDRTVVSVSRQCTATYCTYDGERHQQTSVEHLQNTTLPFPHVTSAQFQHLHVNYEGRNSAMTLKWKKPPPLSYARVWKWPTAHVSEVTWAMKKMYSTWRVLLQKRNSGLISGILRYWLIWIVSLFFKLPHSLLMFWKNLYLLEQRVSQTFSNHTVFTLVWLTRSWIQRQYTPRKH